MPTRAFLLCGDEKAVQAVTQIMDELEVSFEHSSEPAFSLKRLATQRFDLLIVDCDNPQNATQVFNSARASSLNKASIAIAIVEGKAGVPNAFRLGASLVLTKPVSLEQARNTLRTGIGMTRKDAQEVKAPAPAAPTSTPTAPVQPILPVAPHTSAPISTAAVVTPAPVVTPKPAPIALTSTPPVLNPVVPTNNPASASAAVTPVVPAAKNPEPVKPAPAASAPASEKTAPRPAITPGTPPEPKPASTNASNSQTKPSIAVPAAAKAAVASALAASGPAFTLKPASASPSSLESESKAKPATSS